MGKEKGKGSSFNVLGQILVLLLFLLSCTKEEEVKPLKIKFHKPYALLIAESRGCIFCKKLERDLKENELLKESLKDFELIRVKYESFRPIQIRINGKDFSGTERELIRYLGVSSFPGLFFLKGDGEVILELPGYFGVEGMLCALNYVKSKAYKRLKFIDYAKSCG